MVLLSFDLSRSNIPKSTRILPKIAFFTKIFVLSSFFMEPYKNFKLVKVSKGTKGRVTRDDKNHKNPLLTSTIIDIAFFKRFSCAMFLLPQRATQRAQRINKKSPLRTLRLIRYVPQTKNVPVNNNINYINHTNYINHINYKNY